VKASLLVVEEGASRFAPLFAAARQAGLRMGWLELATVLEPPPALANAAGLGATRAVMVAERATLSLKTRHGHAVLRDVVREHFAGCALVLVFGASGEANELPRLRVSMGEPGAWEVAAPGVAAQRYGTEDLLAALRRPRPWSP
jgi:hypothetical protein